MNTAQNQSKKSSHKINPLLHPFCLIIFILPLLAFLWASHFGLPWRAFGLSVEDIYSAVQLDNPTLDQTVINYIVKSVKYIFHLGFILGIFLSAAVLAFYRLFFDFLQFFKSESIKQATKHVTDPTSGHDEDEQNSATLPLR